MRKEEGEEVANKSKNSSAFSLGTLEGAFTFSTERTGTMVTFYAPNVHTPSLRGCPMALSIAKTSELKPDAYEQCYKFANVLNLNKLTDILYKHGFIFLYIILSV